MTETLNVKELAALWGVSESMIRQRRRRGQELIPGVKVGRVLRYRTADALAILRGQPPIKPGE